MKSLSVEGPVRDLVGVSGSGTVTSEARPEVSGLVPEALGTGTETLGVGSAVTGAGPEVSGTRFFCPP